jgi:hypothetical protein
MSGHHAIQADSTDDLTMRIERAKTLDESSLNRIISDQQGACQKQQEHYDTRSGHGAKGDVLDLDP